MAGWTEEDLKDKDGNKYEKVLIPVPGDQFLDKNGNWLPVEGISRDQLPTEVKIRRKLR